MTTFRIPIINLYGNLIVPIQGTVEDEVLEKLREDVTARIESDYARGVVIDISGVDLLDSYMTRSLRDLALVARLMGVHTVVAGVRPEVAITLVEMGLEIPGIESRLNLERALEYLFKLAAAEAEDGIEDSIAAHGEDGDDNYDPRLELDDNLDVIA